MNNMPTAAARPDAPNSGDVRTPDVGAGGLWAVVPVKSFASTKQRLAGALAPEDRARLARAMFGDVLDALTHAPSLAGLLVVTADPDAVEMARVAGAQVLHETRGEGTAAAVALAARELAAAGRAGMLVLPADVPAITVADVETLIAAHARQTAKDKQAAVTLVPAGADGGTNALVCSPPDALPPCFGPDSFRRHVALAQQLGMQPCVLSLARLSRDIDRPEDLQAFLASDEARGTRVWQALRERSALPGDMACDLSSHEEAVRVRHSEPGVVAP
jgi:2-phospho-L-lactate guanylyltransferase